MKQIVVVLGNARSGTSMTAGLLSIVGVDMYQKHNPGPQNPKGSFENEDFLRVTSKMHQLKKKGGTTDQIKKEFGPRIKELVDRREGLWGFKSALTHYNLEIIISYLKNPVIVAVFRNPLHNAQSNIIHKKDIYGQKISLEQSLQMISNSTKVLTDKVVKTPCPKLLVTYEDIKREPIVVLDKMGKFLKIAVTKEMEKKAKEFIMPDYTTLK